MTRTRFTRVLGGAAAAALSAATIAACGGGSSSTTSALPKAPSGSAATFGVASNSGLGKILVNSKGDTLYLF